MDSLWNTYVTLQEHTVIWDRVCKIRTETIFFVILGHFMPFTPPPKKNSWSYPILFLKYISLIIIILGYFLPFYPTNRLKNKNEKKMEKNPWRLIILHKCTKNHDYMLYCSWDMACDRCNCCVSFWAISCPFTPLTAQKMFQKKQKKLLEKSSFYTLIPKNDYRLYCSWDMTWWM